MQIFLRLKNKIKFLLNRAFLSVKSFLNKKHKIENEENFEKLFKKNEIIKLHIGCGPRILRGWINIDLFFEPYENYLKNYTETYYPEEIRGEKSDFYQMDITKERLPFLDNSVDAIYNEDFVEHVDQRDQVSFLAETLRVLKKGGIHRISTPNLLSSMRDNSDFSKGFDGIFFQEWDKNHHKSIFTPNYIKEMALMVGYSEIIFNNRNKSISNLMPKDYRPDPKSRSEDGNIFIDLVK